MPTVTRCVTPELALVDPRLRESLLEHLRADATHELDLWDRLAELRRAETAGRRSARSARRAAVAPVGAEARPGAALVGAVRWWLDVLAYSLLTVGIVLGSVFAIRLL
jgi:hypothetical protein